MKILLTIFALFVFLFNSLALSAENFSFTDRDESTLEGQAALNLYKRGILKGYADGSFGGDRPVNRAEAAKFLITARYGQNIETTYYNGNLVYKAEFSDIDQDEWYAEYINKAAMKGILKGYDDGSFRPADGVLRGEFLKMLTKTFDLEENLPHTFVDAKRSWVDVYAGIVTKYDLFPGIKNTLHIGEPMTRDEVAVAIYQYLQNKD